MKVGHHSQTKNGFLTQLEFVTILVQTWSCSYVGFNWPYNLESWLLAWFKLKDGILLNIFRWMYVCSYVYPLNQKSFYSKLMWILRLVGCVMVLVGVSFFDLLPCAIWRNIAVAKSMQHNSIYNKTKVMPSAQRWTLDSRRRNYVKMLASNDQFFSMMGA